MKHLKKLAAACLALAMVLALTACEDGKGMKPADATALVKGNLDEIYLGVFDPDYLESVGITENQAEETYLGGMESEAQYFFYYYGYEDSYNYVTEEQMQEAVDMYKEIYSKARYTVQDAVEQSDGTFAVKVVFEPIDVHSQITDEDFGAFAEDFFAGFEDVDTESMTDEEWDAWLTEEFYPAYNKAILELVKPKVATLGYEKENSTVIQVVKDEDGYYTMDDTGFQTLDSLLITYP